MREKIHLACRIFQAALIIIFIIGSVQFIYHKGEIAGQDQGYNKGFCSGVDYGRGDTITPYLFRPSMVEYYKKQDSLRRPNMGTSKDSVYYQVFGFVYELKLYDSIKYCKGDTLIKKKYCIHIPTKVHPTGRWYCQINQVETEYYMDGKLLETSLCPWQKKDSVLYQQYKTN